MTRRCPHVTILMFVVVFGATGKKTRIIFMFCSLSGTDSHRCWSSGDGVENSVAANWTFWRLVISAYLMQLGSCDISNALPATSVLPSPSAPRATSTHRRRPSGMEVGTSPVTALEFLPLSCGSCEQTLARKVSELEQVFSNSRSPTWTHSTK